MSYNKSTSEGAVPFTDRDGERVGHINVGALKNKSIFYLIDPYPYNYWNVKKHYHSGDEIVYATPFLYYTKDKEGQRNKTALLKRKVENEMELQETYEKNMMLLSQLMEQGNEKTGLLRARANAAPTVAQLKSEAEEQQYVKVIRDDDESPKHIKYGGDQSWWPEWAKYRRDEYQVKEYHGRTKYGSKWLKNRGCGVVAFTNVVLYHVRKDYETYKDLLKFTYQSKENFLGTYHSDNFKHTLPYNKKDNTVYWTDYVELLDFHADMTANPQFSGVSIGGLEYMFSELNTSTNYPSITYKLAGPTDKLEKDVENFLITHLNNDIPVMFLNLFEVPADNLQYLNDPNEGFANGEISPSQEFSLHWMTITKYFKNNTTGEAAIAFSTWGKRVSINMKLLRHNPSPNTYYSDFLAFEIQPRTR